MIWLKDLNAPFTREIHHTEASFLFLSGWDCLHRCLIYVPLNAREVCADWITLRLIQIYVRKWIWHYHGQALSADIYSPSPPSSLVILTSPRAVLEGRKMGVEFSHIPKLQKITHRHLSPILNCWFLSECSQIVNTSVYDRGESQCSRNSAKKISIVQHGKVILQLLLFFILCLRDNLAPIIYLGAVCEQEV